MENKQYKFSVIMPIYNVEEYLDDAIKSVINQSIGFEENIQIVLINDGSTDNSEKICLKYAQDYPENIIYVKQKNEGVSSARNNGLKYAKGKYINFLDADDKWGYDVFDMAYDFFEEHQNEIDVVACRQKFFEAQDDYHKLDYKFSETQVIDIMENYDYIQLSTASAFFKKEVFDKYQFDTRIKYSEDAILVAQILMDNNKYGLLSNAMYYYRRRKKQNSAIQTRDYNKSWYNETIEYGCKVIIKKSIEKYGKVIPYIQYQIMYDIQWRLRKDLSLYLSEDEKDKYIKELKNILQYIDDNIILEQKYIGIEYRMLTLSLKYSEDIREKLEYKEGKLYFHDLKIYTLANSEAITIKQINIHPSSVSLVGNISYYLPKEDFKIYVNIDDENQLIDKFKTFKTNPSIVRTLKHYKEFKVKIPLNSNTTEIKFIIDYKGNKNNLWLKFDKNANFKIKKKKVKIKKWGLTLSGDKTKIVVRKNK